MEIWKIISEGIMGKPAKTYSQQVADGLATKLDRLAQNPKGYQVRDLVFKLRDKIEATQKAGYTLEDITTEFKTQGVEITVNTLKKYLQESKNAANQNGAAQTLLEKSSSETKRRADSKERKNLSGVDKLNSKDANEPDDLNKEKSGLPNVNEKGVQRMRSDDEL